MRTFVIGVVLMLCMGCQVSHIAETMDRGEEKWARLTDVKRHFHLDYPASWKVNTEEVSRAHSFEVFAALNGAGKEGFTVKEVETGPNDAELNDRLVAKMVPAGTAYIDVNWFEGPGWPQFGPKVLEMEARDLTGLLKESKETQEGKLIYRDIHFFKWGKSWTVTVYMHAPVTAGLREDVEKVLASFRFDGAPAGDKVWALGLARQKLPAEADPEMYASMGGSSTYYCSAKVNGDEVMVTFTKHVGDGPAKSWNYVVTGKGEVRAVGAE